MVAASKSSPRKRRTLKRALPPAPSAGWWGDGAPPWERWPGVTIRLEMAWNAHHRDDAGALVGRWESPCGKYYYDQEAADRAVEFFPEFLTHHVGEFKGHAFVLLDYQELLQTRPLFGMKRVSDGLRRFRKFFGFIPKGGGKSPWGSGTGLFCTLCDDEPSAEVYSCAGDKGQARVVHEDAKIFVEESQELDNMCEILKDTIYDPTTRSRFQVLSSDAATKHGFRPHVVIFDEIHNQPNRDLYEALSKSMVKRRQPLMLIITHAGDDDEGICYEEYELAKMILSGTNPDESSLPVIFEATPDDDWQDPAVWARVNPGHGILVKHDAIAAAAAEAQVQPRKLNDFLRYHLNRWVNSAVAWIPVDAWDACAGPIDEAALRSLPVYAGLDLSQKHDLTALPLVFASPVAPNTPAEVVVVIGEEDGEPIKREISLNYNITIVPFFWIPEDTMREHEKTDGVSYEQWRNAGLVTATEGNVIDYDRILRDITGPITERFPLLKQAEIGYDPAFATDLALNLQAKGYQVLEILQNYKYMSEPMMLLEAFIRGKRVRHDGHRVLRWNIENVAAKTDAAGRIRPVKPKRASKRIDGVVGALMAINRLIASPQESNNDWRPL